MQANETRLDDDLNDVRQAIVALVLVPRRLEAWERCKLSSLLQSMYERQDATGTSHLN
jgi:hypothetical protein